MEVLAVLAVVGSGRGNEDRTLKKGCDRAGVPRGSWARPLKWNNALFRDIGIDALHRTDLSCRAVAAERGVRSLLS